MKKTAKTDENIEKIEEKFANIDKNAEIHPQKLIFDDACGTSPKIESAENVFGELLAYLRKNKMMSALMVCRQISKIELTTNAAEVDASAATEQAILSDENICSKVDEFFKSKGLSWKFKTHTVQKKEQSINELNKILGGRLQIK